jgi:hypothetical protein
MKQLDHLDNSTSHIMQAIEGFKFRYHAATYHKQLIRSCPILENFTFTQVNPRLLQS